MPEKVPDTFFTEAGMTLALDFPLCAQSPLGRLDPRWKLAALLPAAALVALLQTLPALYGAAVGALLLVLAARLPLRWLCTRLAGVALVLAFFLAWLPFIHPAGEESWKAGGLVLSPSGLRLAVVLLLKALTIVTLMLVLLASAPFPETLKAAHALRVPGFLVHVVMLTYRFIFLVGDEFSRLRVALRVRGFRNRATRHGYRTVGQVAGTLLVRSHDRAERVGQAMRCRGFDGCLRSLCAFHTRPQDVAIFVVVVGGAAALFALDLLGR